MVSLAHRVVLITGAGRGLGKGIALELANERMRIALCYRGNRTAAQEVARQIQRRGAEALVLQADVTQSDQVEKLVEGVVRHFGRVDALINNVGEFGWRPVSESTVEEWEQIISSNLLSVFYVTRQVLPVMRRQRYGRIVNLGAIGAERAFGQAKISAYAAAKAAMVAFSRSLAIEEARYGISINVVNPPTVDDQALTRDEAERVHDTRFPIGRPPSAEDVTAAIKFFLSEEAAYTTGQVLTVSGGWML
jgi:3-oxoacyl-[acyl-carrier protein] reductase